MGTLAPPDLALLNEGDDAVALPPAIPIRRVLLIANPASRRGRRRLPAARAAIERAGVVCDVVMTEHSGHAAVIVRERGADYDAIFTLGGDGTAMEAASALAGSGRPLAVLAGGTGNLLARAVGIPLDANRAVRRLLEGAILEIDLGYITSLEPARHFAVAAGAGIDATMVAETPGWLKRRLGVHAYTITATRAALRAVLRRRYFGVRVVVDGEELVAPAAAAVMIANFGAVLSDRITFGPGIHSDDGVLDVCLYTPRNLRDALRIMWRLLRKNFASDDAMHYRQGCRIRIETDPPQCFQADGELLGMTPVEIVVEPRAVRLLVPVKPSSRRGR